MKHFIIFPIFIFITSVVYSQNKELENAYECLINSIYNNMNYQKAGSLLPYPREIKTNNKKNIIFVKPINRLSNRNRINNFEKNTQILFLLDSNILHSIDKMNLSLYHDKIIDTVHNISNDYEFNLLGSIIMNNIYVRKNYKHNNFNEIFFEIIRINNKSSKVYSIDIIHLEKMNNEWQVKNNYNIEKL